MGGAGSRPPNMKNVPMPARSKGMAVREAGEMMWLARLHELKPEMIFISACFVQAEDGIRDSSVTGVKTCALPIFRAPRDRLDLNGAVAGLLVVDPPIGA